MRLSIFISALFAMSLAAQGHARPVSYPGGWTLIAEGNAFQQSLLAHYSPSAKVSVGLRMAHLDEPDALTVGPQVNVLLKRWNARVSQGNLYWKSGAGVLVDGPTGAAGFTGLAADWETRRLFLSYSLMGRVQPGEDQIVQSGRLGWAPYEGDFGDLHTWVMVQVDRRDGRVDDWEVTPLVRLFKGVALAEAGISLEGNPLLNFTYRF
ncbi:MAG: hypothetical protein V2J26_05210 [Pacificimonas sp.]|nr:hypothetical protein [Pacificimonas sp.]